MKCDFIPSSHIHNLMFQHIPATLIHSILSILFVISMTKKTQINFSSLRNNIRPQLYNFSWNTVQLFYNYTKLRSGFPINPFTWYVQSYCSSIADVNECSLNNNGCHQNATCSNTQGSFACNCNKGFSGNGTYCTGKDLFIVVLFTFQNFSCCLKASAYLSLPYIFDSPFPMLSFRDTSYSPKLHIPIVL